MSWRLLICCLLGILCPLFAFADTLIVAGRTQTLTAPLLIEGDEVLAPLVPALELLGARSTITNSTISIKSSDGRALKMTVDSAIAECAGQQIPLMVAPREIDGVLYLPARALASWLYAESHFDNNSRTLTVYPLLQVSYEIHGDEVAIIVRSAAPLQYTSGHMSAPARTFYDFKFTSLGMAEEEIPVNQGVVQRLRIAQFSATPAVVRLVADLNGDGIFTAGMSAQGHILTIFVHAGQPPAPQLQTPAPQVPLPATPPAEKPLLPFKLLDLSLASPSGKQSELQISADNPVTVDSDYDTETHQLVLRFDKGYNTLPPGHLHVDSDKLVAKIEADGSADTPGTRLTITFKKDVGYLITHEPCGIKVTMGVFGLADMTIVLDPGHGGYDTGAPGCNGSCCEKEITLAVALRTARLLQAVGAQVLLTRTNDTFIPLNDRSGLANAQHADVFVSMHCNSSPVHNSSNGTEIYYTTPQSLALAASMHGEIIKALELKDGGIRSRSLSVTRKSRMPAILIELAYINNDREEELLCSDAFQQKAAEAIVNGLRKYAASNVWKLRHGEVPG